MILCTHRGVLELAMNMTNCFHRDLCRFCSLWCCALARWTCFHHSRRAQYIASWSFAGCIQSRNTRDSSFCKATAFCDLLVGLSRFSCSQMVACCQHHIWTPSPPNHIDLENDHADSVHPRFKDRIHLKVLPLHSICEIVKSISEFNTNCGFN
jgi:hypothetical protein